MVRTDIDRFMFRQAQGNLLRAKIPFRRMPKSTLVLIPFTVLHIQQPCSFFFSCRFRVQTLANVGTIHPMRMHWLKMFQRILCISLKSPHPRTMSLLGVLEFSVCLRVLPSSMTPPTPLTGIRPNPCATPLWGGPSGHLADPTPNTVHACSSGRCLAGKMVKGAGEGLEEAGDVLVDMRVVCSQDVKKMLLKQARMVN